MAKWGAVLKNYDVGLAEVALASLVANKAEYSKVNKKFALHWRAKEILCEIEKINPLFYPIPTRQILDPTTGKVKETRLLESGFLTRAEFIELYDNMFKRYSRAESICSPQNVGALIRACSKSRRDSKLLLFAYLVLTGGNQVTMFVTLAFRFLQIATPETEKYLQGKRHAKRLALTY